MADWEERSGVYEEERADVIVRPTSIHGGSAMGDSGVTRILILSGPVVGGDALPAMQAEARGREIWSSVTYVVPADMTPAEFAERIRTVLTREHR